MTPAPARANASAVARPMPVGRSTRLATPDRWHLTLAFLGDLPDERAPRAVAALDAVRFPPVEVRIAGGGRFGRGRFTTLWAGLRGDLGELSRAVRRELKKARLPYDPKPFRPHLTLARPGDRIAAEELAGDLARLDVYSGPLWTIKDIRLVRSFLGPHPTYETLATRDLG